MFWICNFLLITEILTFLSLSINLLSISGNIFLELPRVVVNEFLFVNLALFNYSCVFDSVDKVILFYENSILVLDLKEGIGYCSRKVILDLFGMRVNCLMISIISLM